MDGRSFDDLTRALGAAVSRRSAWRVLAGGAAALAASGIGAGGAEAATCPRDGCCKCSGEADSGEITRACFTTARNHSDCTRLCRQALGEDVTRTTSYRIAPRGKTARCNADETCSFVRCAG